MSVFTWSPQSVQRPTKPNVHASKFGDGYEQRILFGLNQNPQSWSLSFAFKTAADFDACDAFLNGLSGVGAFDWTPPRGASPLRFTCKDWTPTGEVGSIWKLTATFTQVFGS